MNTKATQRHEGLGGWLNKILKVENMETQMRVPIRTLLARILQKKTRSGCNLHCHMHSGSVSYHCKCNPV